MKNKNPKPLLALSGIILCYIIITSLLFMLLKDGKIGLPFSKIVTINDAWFSVLKYLPVFAMSVSMLLWVWISGTSILRPFYWHWKKNSPAFIIGLGVSLYYSVNMLFFTKQSLNGLPLCFPLVILCLLNAFSEEILYRHVIMGLFQKNLNSRIIANLLQSIFYAVPHLVFGSFIFAFYAFCYGCLLGTIKNRSDSITPCLICHFFIDIGAIGAPLL